MWTGALFLGEFRCPLAVLGLSSLLGGLGWALVAMGVLALVLAGAVLVGRPAVPLEVEV